MGDLILYLGITIVGYIIGSKVRNRRNQMGWTGKVQTAALFCLVLMMGMRMGSNEEITANLSTIGLTALVITLVTIICSIGAITLTRKLMGIDRYGRLRAKSEGSEKVSAKAVSSDESTGEARCEAASADVTEAAAVVSEGESGEEKSKGMDMMTVVIVIAVAVGMAVGYFIIRNVFEGRMDTFDSIAGTGIKIGLCLLLVFVGIDLGLDGTVIDNFKKVGLRIFAFPAVVVVATLVSSTAAGMVMGLSFKESLAIGAGFGWYTLAPGIIMEAGYLTASAVSFLHNVLRELLSIVFIPLVAAKIGYIETTGMPGAAAMDVCLPIVEKSTRSDIAVYSFVSGVLLSILVPVLVPIIIG